MVGARTEALVTARVEAAERNDEQLSGHCDGHACSISDTQTVTPALYQILIGPVQAAVPGAAVRFRRPDRTSGQEGT